MRQHAEPASPAAGLPDQAGASATTWIGFGVMCLGMFMAILDIQVVATSMPTIQAAIGIAPDQISWIQTAYLIAEVIAIPLTGYLTRLLGLRWLFVLAVGMFTTASLGCALADKFVPLIGWRVAQGFSGGTLIPAVFSAVFLLFPARGQALATTLAGVLAVLAPTVGPIVGGWITETYSWRWLFLINLAPGVLCCAVATFALPAASRQAGQTRRLDLAGLLLMATALTALIVALKEAPARGWLSLTVAGAFTVALIAAAGFARRTLGARYPVVELRTLGDRTFAAGCVLSFILGVGLFGSVYLMPVFLGYVRGYDALAIGSVMLVTGAAQLLTAPVAVLLERRLNTRLLAGAGFLMFAIGLGLSAFQTRETGFSDMLWPQVLRGVAVMFCLLPPTRMALGGLSAAQVPDASGLFNLMRNLGGAIGLALIDTIIYGRAPSHAHAIVARLQAGDLETAKAVGIPTAVFLHRGAGPIDPAAAAILEPMIKRLALVQSINEAWAAVAVLTLAGLLLLPFSRSKPPLSRPAGGSVLMNEDADLPERP